MQNKAPTLLYFFEHIVLRDAFFGNPLLMKDIETNPETLQSKLIDTFNKVKNDPKITLEDREIELQPTDFSTELYELSNNNKLTVIECPKPKKSPEVLYIGLVTGNQPRYFVSEFESNEEMKQMFPEKTWDDKYILCEWQLNKHVNYGEVAGNKDSFSKSVETVLNG